MVLVLKIMRLLLPMLFMSYLATTNLFVHSHIVAGRIVVHSHTGNANGHTHTTSELGTICVASHLSFSDDTTSGCNTELFFLPYIVAFGNGNSAAPKSAIITNQQSRAPPSFYFV